MGKSVNRFLNFTRLDIFRKWKISKRESAVLKLICRRKMRSSGRRTKRLVSLPMHSRQLRNISVRNKSKTTGKRKGMTLNNKTNENAPQCCLALQSGTHIAEKKSPQKHLQSVPKSLQLVFSFNDYSSLNSFIGNCT